MDEKDANVERQDWIARAVERADALMATMTESGPHGDLMRRRVKAWSLRIKGYDYATIAEKNGCSFGTAYLDVRWCLDNLPAAYDTIEDFRTISMARLDQMIQQLAPRGEELNEADGETDLDRARLRAQLIKQQGELLGIQHQVKVQADTTVRYEVAGIDPGQLR